MTAKEYDVIIIGGGPSGCATALYLKNSGLKILLIDKAKFPREKVCGDALSTYPIKRLKELKLFKKLQQIPLVKINHVTFSAPNKKIIKLRTTPVGYEDEICGYTCTRYDFDNFLIQEVKKTATFMEECKVTKLLKENGKLVGVTTKNKKNVTTEFKSKLVIGADGYNSIISRNEGFFDNDPKHWMISVRGYFKNVTNLSDAIEMHYSSQVIPGYFWIFPSPNNLANVGLCIPKKFAMKKNINLNNLFNSIIKGEQYKERFSNAELVGKIKGWTLPVGTTKRKSYGDGFLLVGDAAGLIDPFSGEGIGNALTSGKFASEIIKNAFKENNFSKNFLRQYNQSLWNKMEPEFQLSNKLIQLTRFPLLINFVINRAIKSNFVKNWLSGVVAETIPRKELTSFSTYMKLLFYNK